MDLTMASVMALVLATVLAMALAVALAMASVIALTMAWAIGPAGLRRANWTLMSKLSGQARPDKMDIDVRIVRAGWAGQNGH